MKPLTRPSSKRKVAQAILAAWAAAAEGKPPPVKKRLAEMTLAMWAAAAEGTATKRPD